MKLYKWSDLTQQGKTAVLVAAHRGKFGAQIPENSLESCEFALRLGADILEVDVCKTKDGELILFHGPKLDRVTTGKGPVSDYTFNEIKQMRFVSAIGQVTNKSVNTLDEFLERFKDRCLINLDRCWHYFDDVFDVVKRYSMTEQILFKSPKPAEESLRWLSSRNLEPHFMPIVRKYSELEEWLAYSDKIRMPAVELVFDNENSRLISAETIGMLHEKNIKVWLNALTLKEVLAAGHDDTVSVLNDPEEGWGWLVKRGADVIQTDWVLEIIQYMENAGYRQNPDSLRV